MGKAAPQAAMPPPVPAPPPTTAVRGADEDRTPTEVMVEREEAKEAVVTSPDTAPTPQKTSLPASVIDTETAGRKEEKRIAGMKGRRSTRATGPRGLLEPAKTSKRGLMGS